MDGLFLQVDNGHTKRGQTCGGIANETNALSHCCFRTRLLFAWTSGTEELSVEQPVWNEGDPSPNWGGDLKLQTKATKANNCRNRGLFSSRIVGVFGSPKLAGQFPKFAFISFRWAPYFPSISTDHLSFKDKCIMYSKMSLNTLRTSRLQQYNLI